MNCRTVSKLLLAAFIGAGGTIPLAAEKPAGEPLQLRPYEFESRSGELVSAELGEIWVPENRGRDSRRIKLSFVRFASTSERPGPPIVYLAGGPGGSGIETARGPRFPLFMALRRQADVIAFDQRGTGLSSSIEPCRAGDRYPFEKPLERQPLLAMIEKTGRECASRWREQGVDLGGYTTSESADDLEALRQALGVPKITLWGISYGTHLAFAALRRHPGSIHRAILASAEGPDETIKLPGRTQGFLERVDALAKQDRALREAVPHLLATMRRVLSRLGEEPVVVETADPRTGEPARVGIGKLDLQILTGFLIKNPDSLRRLPGLYLAMDGGNFSSVAPFVLGMRSYLSTWRGMPEAMDAVSGTSSRRKARILAERESALLEDTLNLPALADWSLADVLGLSELPASFRSPLTSDVPALFLSGTLDGRTYPESHRELASGFARVSFVSIEGAGHDLFMSSPEVEERILDFLARGETSERPIEVDVPPFIVPAAGPRPDAKSSH